MADKQGVGNMEWIRTSRGFNPFKGQGLKPILFFLFLIPELKLGAIEVTVSVG
jgi:hypothetical protein